MCCNNKIIKKIVKNKLLDYITVGNVTDFWSDQIRSDPDHVFVTAHVV